MTATCDNAIFKNKIKLKRFKKKKLLGFFVGLIAVILLFVWYFNKIVNPIIISTGEAKVKSLATKAINTAVTEVLCEGYTYDDIIDIKFNESGDISFIQARSLIINKLSRDLVSTSQSKLDIIGEQGLGIPYGTLSGVPLLMGKGPELRLKLFPIGAITCSFDSKFTEAGINHTNHKIYANINSTVSVILPVSARHVKSTSQILLCESIIVGKVPEVYLKSTSLDEMMNLIP